MRSTLGTLVDIVVLVLAACFVLWFFLPTTLFLEPKSVTYDEENGQVLFVRKTPLPDWFGPVKAKWETEVVTLNHRECYDTGVSTYQKVGPSPNRPADTVVYPIDDAIADCLATGARPIVASSTWRYLVFGSIPLRRGVELVTRLN